MSNPILAIFRLIENGFYFSNSELKIIWNSLDLNISISTVYYLEGISQGYVTEDFYKYNFGLGDILLKYIK